MLVYATALEGILRIIIYAQSIMYIVTCALPVSYVFGMNKTETDTVGWSVGPRNLVDHASVGFAPNVIYSLFFSVVTGEYYDRKL